MDFQISFSFIILLFMAGGLLKFLVTIGLLGQGLGLSGGYFSIVNFALSLALAALLFQPLLGVVASDPTVFSGLSLSSLSAEQAQRLLGFLQFNSDSDVTTTLKNLPVFAAQGNELKESFNFYSLAFLLTELREACLLGALLLLPMILIDLLLGIIFSALTIQAVSVRQLALPLKLLLFLSVDGWNLLVQNFINQYSF